MKVKIFIINKNQSGQYFGLKNAEEGGNILHFSPRWKTEKGAINWAKKHGFTIEGD